MIPEGTQVLRVEASTPHFAINKVRRGKGEHLDAGAVAVPASAVIAADDRPYIHPGQLRMSVERPEPDARLLADELVEAA